MSHTNPHAHAILPMLAAALLLAAQPASLHAEDLFQFMPQTFTEGLEQGDASAENTTVDAGPQSYDEVEIVRERYPDGKIRIERQVTLDAEGNYVNHGAWRLFSPTEKVVAEGQFEMGKRVGSWTRWLGSKDSPIFSQPPFSRFKAPYASQAIFNNGELEGEWLITDAENRKMMQVSFSAGKRHGLVVTFLPNGKPFRQASYDQGVPVGDVMEADKNGELKHVSTYIDGRKIITKTAHHKSNNRNRKAEAPKKSEEMYLAATTVEATADNFWSAQLATYKQQGSDLRHGPSRTWFENGQLQVEGNYQNDKRYGGFTYWYANGQIAAMGEYRDDLPTDVWVWWHENGLKAAVGKYDGGALVDQWRWWDANGKLVQKKVHDGSETVSAEAHGGLELSRVPQLEKVEVATRPDDAQTTR